MSRFVPICCVLLAGCGELAQTDKTSHGIDAAIPHDDVVTKAIETGAWLRVTERPIQVTARVAFACAPAFIEESSGPHFKPSIVVRTNPESLEAFKAKQSPMPVGTVVIKEKHETKDASDATKEFGAMIKREPGFDPEHGDWEYVYGSISPGVKLERGKLANCIACHEAYAKDRDYLFRSYLPDAEISTARSGR